MPSANSFAYKKTQTLTIPRVLEIAKKQIQKLITYFTITISQYHGTHPQAVYKKLPLNTITQIEKQKQEKIYHTNSLSRHIGGDGLSGFSPWLVNLVVLG